MSLTGSIVICTDGRRTSLATTLQSLRQLDGGHLEVCIVAGPTDDGTREMIQSWPEPLKCANIEVHNLSVARNRGIELASGDIVAFLDDDAIPEAGWFNQILAGYANARVGAVGGKVFDHTGLALQWRYGTTDRLGRADLSWSRAAGELNFPFSYNFPHLLGANSTFRRTALIEIGGFDEEFDYFLDETDVLARVVDAGWSVVQLDDAYVHHKYAASQMRSEARIIKSWDSILKNKLYYGLMHRHGRHGVREVLQEFDQYCQGHRDTCRWAISAGHLTEDYIKKFEEHVDRALAVGLMRGLSDERKLMSPDRCSTRPPDFRPYRATPLPAERRCVVFLTQEYPPGPVGGTARYVHEIATGMAALGHDVHVLTLTGERSHVNFEDGVWVHRLVPGYVPDDAGVATAGLSAHSPAGPIPEDIWRKCATRLVYLDWLSERKAIDCVYSLIWDCEGAAILRAGRHPLVVGLQTTLAFWLENNPERQQDEAFMTSFGRPMLALEAEMLAGCAAIHAISGNILRDIEQRYGLSLEARTRVIPLGFEDFTTLTIAEPAAAGLGIDLRVLFVGRLEARKGIDLLLSIAPDVLRQFPNVQLDVVGNDQLPGPNGITYRQAFESQDLPPDIAQRIVFHGEVEGKHLRGFYKSCDVFVAPSRYESFGIVFVEAMMFAKPVIGCRAGGMLEIIVDGETGLLAEPGDAASLRDTLTRLIFDADLRARMGRAGRLRYETQFEKVRMVGSVAELMIAASPAGASVARNSSPRSLL